ncbi:hypothetical protein HMPREF2880_03345 [Neisseria sp. HMSC067G11]|jgi:hypothetical protein|uniref:hypothetical protein n=1 Tax=Neisseria TaxID=482 RepID=UPI00066D9ADF|nr:MULTISPECIES: hypothetical protein [unclassified Neisseria]OFK03167.1 hypothetical protein HMPREF2834_11135 [Neisseria sp. HMSC067H04]OFR55489.1 hypothetical protein HMPREF2880_03345 [Neisseria sp. HMSC067G11]OFR74384.1 hypothetical protein HMPREF2871_07470 [Neisseria sp. HMSC067G12]DAX43740.1 MAG TPA: hypothetical protein [Caudoviricetes sp.]
MVSIAYPRNVAVYNPKYAAIFNITNSPEFEDALGVFSWQAQRVLTRTFQSLEKFEHGVSLWSYKETYKVSLVEEQVNDALERYQEQHGGLIDYAEYFYPVIEELNFGQSFEMLLEMQYFITAKAIYEYVSNFKDKPLQENFSQFKTIANLITASIEFMSLELRKDQISIEAITENAKKASKAKQSPYEKAGTIAAVNQLLEEKKEMLNQWGGKSELCRIIQDLIVTKGIPCPAKREPTEKTIMKWINQFQKNMELTS